MNLNLLVVDDEYEILTWLEELFSYNFEPKVDVYTANSAYAAIEMLNHVKFDVVLTDIRMPGMNGIALFQHVKGNWPRCKTIFLTGYPNFEEIYKIIKHKDVRYILKSEDDEVITQAVRGAFSELQQELEQEALLEKQQQDMKKYKGWVKREFMERLLKSGQTSTDETDMVTQAQECDFPIAIDKPFIMFLVRIDASAKRKEHPTDQYVLLEKANKFILNSLSTSMKHYLYVVEGHWSVGLIQSAETVENIVSIAKGAIEYAQSIFELSTAETFSVAIESTPMGYSDVPAMFFRMKQIMVGGLDREKSVIAHVETINIQKEQAISGKAITKVSVLKTHLELHHRHEFFEALYEVSNELLNLPGIHDRNGKGLYYSIAMLLLHFINENRLDEQTNLRIDLSGLTNVDEFHDWHEAIQYLYNVSAAIFELMDGTTKDISDRALKRICDYIEKNLDKDLSLTTLADIGGFNSSYLSRLFKLRFDVTITDYINQKRMKTAAILLTTTNKRIQEISEKTGYLSSHSFIRAFKNFYRASPTEYREVNK